MAALAAAALGFALASLVALTGVLLAVPLFGLACLVEGLGERRRQGRRGPGRQA